MPVYTVSNTAEKVCSWCYDPDKKANKKCTCSESVFLCSQRCLKAHLSNHHAFPCVQCHIEVKGGIPEEVNKYAQGHQVFVFCNEECRMRHEGAKKREGERAVAADEGSSAGAPSAAAAAAAPASALATAASGAAGALLAEVRAPAAAAAAASPQGPFLGVVPHSSSGNHLVPPPPLPLAHVPGSHSPAPPAVPFSSSEGAIFEAPPQHSHSDPAMAAAVDPASPPKEELKEGARPDESLEALEAEWQEVHKLDAEYAEFMVAEQEIERSGDELTEEVVVVEIPEAAAP